MAETVDQSNEPKTTLTAAERAARRKLAQTGEAERGLWQRTTFRRAIIEATAIFSVWRLLTLVPITFWPGAAFPFILLGLLILRFAPPVWSASRMIATRREKMSKRFFKLAGVLALTSWGAEILITLFIGEARPPFGGPLYGPDIALLLNATHAPHHLALGDFLFNELALLGLLLGYYLIATICTRLAQGGFLRFTMPAGDGRVTL